MRASDKAYKRIKLYEGMCNKAYQCQAGVWTIGYGHTKNVKPGHCVTLQQANELLRQDVAEIEHDLNKCVAGLYLTQNQYDALICLIFNIGITAFRNSTLLRLLRAKSVHRDDITRWWCCWCKVTDPVTKQKVTSNGLLTRRQKEVKLFFGE